MSGETLGLNMIDDENSDKNTPLSDEEFFQYHDNSSGNQTFSSILSLEEKIDLPFQ